MAPELVKTALLGEWVIAARTHTDKHGIKVITGNKYPIPEEILKEMAFDFLVKEAAGCERGYKFDLHNTRTGEVYKVTVERLTTPEKVI